MCIVDLPCPPCWHRNGLARTDNVLAYGHHGWMGQHVGLWPTSAHPVGKPVLARYGQTGYGQGENIMPLTWGWGHKTYETKTVKLQYDENDHTVFVKARKPTPPIRMKNDASIFGLMSHLASWPTTLIVPCRCRVDHLYHLASESVNQLSTYSVDKFDNRQTKQMDRLTTLCLRGSTCQSGQEDV